MSGRTGVDAAAPAPRGLLSEGVRGGRGVGAGARPLLAPLLAPGAPLGVMYCCVLSRPCCTLIPRCIERSVS